MKKIIFSFLALMLIAGSICCQEKIDIEKEKEAIKQVVQAQLDAIKAASYDGEAALWAQRPYIVRKDIVGWDSVSVFYQEMFKKWNDEPENFQARVFTASNFDIYINGNFVSVFHDEHFEGIVEGEEMTSDGRAHKYIEKIEGEWKIITLF
jgi:hypothetical protein